MKGFQKKRINTEKFLKTKETENSFLVETSFNSDIDTVTRNEIEIKYQKSKVNSEYMFPRVSSHKKSKSKQLSSKNSFENLGKFTAVHKSTRSNIVPIIIDPKPQEKQFNNKLSFPIKIPRKQKVGDKKNFGKYRGISYRQIKTERNNQSKSPKNSKKFIDVYSKNIPGSCKKIGSSEIVNLIFAPYSSNAKLLNSDASMRLKKIFHNVKQNYLN